MPLVVGSPHCRYSEEYCETKGVVVRKIFVGFVLMEFALYD